MDLDSFFAKRDKKKPKGQKFLSTDEMAKRLEETDRKEEKAVLQAVSEAHIKREAGNEERTKTPEVPEHAEEQWKDFEDKPEVDVSDLKIAKLELSDEENAGSDANDEDGSNCGDGKNESVWNVEPKQMPSICDAVDSAIEDGKDVAATVAAVRATAKPTPARPSEMVAAPLPKGGNRRKKNAPDFKSEEAFPTLGMKPKKNKNKKNEMVGGNTPKATMNGSRSAAPAAAPGAYLPPHLRSGASSNRFGRLTDQGADRF